MKTFTPFQAVLKFQTYFTIRFDFDRLKISLQLIQIEIGQHSQVGMIFLPVLKSQTGLSSVRLSCKRTRRES